MAIRLWKDPDTEFCDDPPGWEGGMTADSNPNVAFLMMETDASKDEWGWAPMYWNSEIGNVWAVREDGQDLAVNDVAMMCHFARRKLQLRSEWGAGKESVCVLGVTCFRNLLYGMAITLKCPKFDGVLKHGLQGAHRASGNSASDQACDMDVEWKRMLRERLDVHGEAHENAQVILDGYVPRGTGKSSFSLSLAGEFELDIYTLQLSGISDSKLMKLFAELPPHCIVLLEDVDAAGMGRRDGADADQESNSGSRVTPSGLLNVLDGASSQEGRVLIMTTNHIEHLDEALIRPGLFKQTPGHKQSKRQFGDETIERLADNFASKVPDQFFSPAEVLSFLMEQKNSPFGAVTGVETWVAKAKEAVSQLKRESSWVQ
ncbi:Mitochondrial chaperone BCS1 [Penicillium oxalicum]|uniref:Mitochondrial chaperone BCS1 n=1 Tax=Penicillium oxalicum TaxID=69781 RepID=UPI0020B8B3B2|nr:Mitochondrial chaperone BCS1 [Penicillium oxalicum]KAI2791694.1 Mitochondrial chaperone BCS1 [Penicillium oxalicum]